MEAENNHPINNTSFFTYGLPCLHPRLYEMLVNNTAKKRNFSELETDLKKKKKKRIKLCCLAALKSGIKGSHKRHVWKEITTAASSVGVENRAPADVKIFYSCEMYISYMAEAILDIQYIMDHYIIALAVI